MDNKYSFPVRVNDKGLKGYESDDNVNYRRPRETRNQPRLRSLRHLDWTEPKMES